ncbi:hypothetical protein RD110_10635 [Rhodoferax koreense]|uniref:Uncharacterized protein n=1 Tax=Rhodoferax koreensis TaxID=1842727 RepID=A0A1P8JV18_9BURK|nr:hypothetical protein [Rhodoferax koreense]APW37585.1 hypothetical protein RD110_10635 [Rhodoferax koreense]
MKLSAETPPDGDFVRYLEALERSSPAYQALRPTVAEANPDAVPRGRPRAVAAEPLANLKTAALRQSPAVRNLALPLLQRLEQALAAAAKKQQHR